MMTTATYIFRINRVHRGLVCQKNVSSWTQFKKDWKEMQDATKPQPNESPDEPEVTLRNILKLPLRSHWLVLKESLYLYKLTWTDRDAAVRELTKDDMILDAARGKKETGEKIEINDLLESIEKLYPKLAEDMAKVGSVNDVVSAVSNNKEGLKQVAADRLEVMGEVIRHFMEGYREGKEAGHREAMADDNNFMQSMYDLTNANDDHGGEASKSKENNKEEMEKDIKTSSSTTTVTSTNNGNAATTATASTGSVGAEDGTNLNNTAAAAVDNNDILITDTAADNDSNAVATDLDIGGHSTGNSNATAAISSSKKKIDLETRQYR